MRDLFDDIISEKPVQTKMTELKISSKGGKVLSKSQQTFNKLVKNIEQHNQKLKDEVIKLDLLLELYSKNASQLKKQKAEQNITTAKLIAQSAAEFKFGKKQNEKTQEVIVWLCREAFQEIEPDAETIAFYDSWAMATTYKEEHEEQREMLKENLAEIFKMRYGIDLDFTQFDDTPEGFAKFQETFKDEFEKKKSSDEEFASKKRKSKKYREKETELKQEEVLKLKSIRSIYVSLAKMLHPDTETDAVEKLVKEELMKKVTNAYNEKDLNTLLRLEMEWVTSYTDNLESLAEDKLKIYIAALKQQLDELKTELDVKRHHPRYHDIGDFSWLSLQNGKKYIREIEINLNEEINFLKRDMKKLQKNLSKKTILDQVNELHEAMEMEQDFFDDDIFDQPLPF